MEKTNEEPREVQSTTRCSWRFHNGDASVYGIMCRRTYRIWWIELETLSEGERMPAIPTMTGGKLVTGTLNGGGPEISVSTMNGDVTLRQLEVKK